MATRATSHRLDSDLKDRLAERAAAERVSERALLEELIHEGLRMREHPGIVFRDGATGRRAGLADGADVWEVASGLRYTEGSEAERLEQLSEQFGRHPNHFRPALDYYAAHRAEIDAWVAANDAAARELEEAARRRADLMAG